MSETMTATAHAPPSLMQEKVAVQNDIPVVDFQPFLQGDASQQEKTAEQLTDAFKKYGFVYLYNHGVPQSEIDAVFQASAAFFRLSPEVKNRLAWQNPQSNRGYVAQGREQVSNEQDESKLAALRASQPDAKESFEIGREAEPRYRNHWPEESEAPGFRETMLIFRKTVDRCYLKVLRAIAIGLNLPPTFFDDKCNEEWHNLRLLHYPSIPVSRSTDSRAGEHTDYGCLTFLFQDSVGGLEVKNPNTGQFAPGTPIPGTIVINVGDLMSRWSNDILTSTLHRVVAPTSRSEQNPDMLPERYSVAYFLNPNEETMIETIPTCYGKEQESLYEPVKTVTYMERRLQATYA